GGLLARLRLGRGRGLLLADVVAGCVDHGGARGQRRARDRGRRQVGNGRCRRRHDRRLRVAYRRLRRCRLGCASRLGCAGRALRGDGDPEGADGEVVVGLQQHQRTRRQRVALAPGVLDQVFDQLVSHLRLVGRELLAIGWVQEDGVLVRHVDAVDRDGLVVVHLLGQLACQLDRLHGRTERAREHALEEAADLLLDVAKEAQPCIPVAEYVGDGRYRPSRKWGAATAEAAGSIATSAAAPTAGASAPGWLARAAGSPAATSANPIPHSASACTRRPPAWAQATGRSTLKPITASQTTTVAGERSSAVR